MVKNWRNYLSICAGSIKTMIIYCFVKHQDYRKTYSETLYLSDFQNIEFQLGGKMWSFSWNNLIFLSYLLNKYHEGLNIDSSQLNSTILIQNLKEWEVAESVLYRILEGNIKLKKMKGEDWDFPIFLKRCGNHSHSTWLCPSDGAEKEEIPLKNNLSKDIAEWFFWARTNIT